MEKIGLVLEGGGMRGSYTLGILDVLLEEKLYFPYVIGVSAGACNAASYCSRQQGRGQRIQETYLPDPRYLSLRNLFSKGRSLYGMDFIFDKIPSLLDPFDFDSFYSSGTQAVVGVTDVETGRCVYLDTPPRSTYNAYLRASSSIPLFSPVVTVDGRSYLDGGVSDAIPFEEALRHCDRVVVVLTRPRGYVKSPTPCKPLFRAALRRYPHLVCALENRHLRYRAQLDALSRLEAEGRAFVFRPDEINVSVFEKNPEKLRSLYAQGRRHAQLHMESLRSFLSAAQMLPR